MDISTGWPSLISAHGYIHGYIHGYPYPRQPWKYCVIHISETRGAIDTKFAGYIHPVLPEVFSTFGVARSRGGSQRRGVEHFLGWGYSFSWIGQLPFVFAWASSNVVQYIPWRTFWCKIFQIGQGVSTRWPKKYENLYFFDNFWSLLPCISETTKNIGISLVPKIKVGISPVQLCHLYWRIFPQLSTGWIKASLVQFCNLNFFDNFYFLFTSLYLRNDRESRHTMNTRNKGGFLPCATMPFIPAYLSWEAETYTRWAKT